MTDSTNQLEKKAPSRPMQGTKQRSSSRRSEDELALAQRRIELAREENSRLNDALSAARSELNTYAQTSAKRFASLEEELENVRRALSIKEQELVQSESARSRFEAKCEKRKEAIQNLRRNLQLIEQDLNEKDQLVADLEEEKGGLQARLDELPAGLFVEGADQPLPRSSEIATTSILSKFRSTNRYVLLSGVIAVALLGVLAWTQLEIGSLSAVSSESPEASTNDSENQPDSRTGQVSSVTHRSQRQGEEIRSPILGPSPETPRHFVRDRLKSGIEGPALIALDPGRFDMGSRPVFGTEDAYPIHSVNIARFYMGVYEVTFAQYDVFARSTGRRLPDDFGWGRGDRPVVNVSWVEATDYVDWLSNQTGERYRLPSEAEWEYATRANSSTPYWWGFEVGAGRAACFDCGSQWDNRSTAPIGSFAANPFGLHDTAGNVMEWVADCYQGSYETAPGDGRAWQSRGDCAFRVARGGAFNKPARSMRSTSRHRFGPDTRINMLGFRVARDL